MLLSINHDNTWKCFAQWQACRVSHKWPIWWLWHSCEYWLRRGCGAVDDVCRVLRMELQIQNFLLVVLSCLSLPLGPHFHSLSWAPATLLPAWLTLPLSLSPSAVCGYRGGTCIHFISRNQNCLISALLSSDHCRAWMWRQVTQISVNARTRLLLWHEVAYRLVALLTCRFHGFKRNRKPHSYW